MPPGTSRPPRRVHKRSTAVSRPPPYRVAIVGFGPRGFGCLERLALEVAKHGVGLPPISVTAHDPQPHPGAGPPYDPQQPEWLLLNFSAVNVDIWSDDHDLLPRDQRPNFLEWLGRNHAAWALAHAFVPRRLLGSYLRDSFASLHAALPAGLAFRHVRGEVVDVEFSGGGWAIRHDDPALDMGGVDQVMVATGHGTWSGNQAFDSWSRELPEAPDTRRIPGVYPVEEQLSREVVPHGAMVGVRGFALTAIDAMLTLTVGRGGTFEEEGGSHIPRYRGQGGDEVTLVPFCRTGLPPLAKPGAALVQRSGELTELWEHLRQGLLDAIDLTPATVLQRIRQAEVQALAALRGRASGPAPPGADPGGPDPLRTMKQSVLVAAGVLPPDRSWARGEAWRQAYPAVVERASEGGLAATFPAAFGRLAGNMERYAFGPPGPNLARVVALVAAGRLDLRALREPRIRADERRLVLHGEGSPIALDVLVNAMVPPPGVHAETPLLLRLVQRGFASLVPGWDGVMISPGAASIGRDGQPTPGLSMVGRATEGWVVGNDTLGRTLHHHTRRWARRILREATASAAQVGLPVAGVSPS